MNDHDSPPILARREELLEERGNRDAFWLCLTFMVVVAIGLIVLGIAVANTRFIAIPVASLEFPAVSNDAGLGVRKLSNRAAPLGVAAPRTSFVPATHLRPVPSAYGRAFVVRAKSDPGVVEVAPSCRPEFSPVSHP